MLKIVTMKKSKLLGIIATALFCSSLINAQNVFNASNASLNHLNNTTIVNEIASNWFLSLGLNIIDDGGAGYNNAHPLNTNSSHFSNPFMLGAEYNTGTNFSINTSFSFNKYLIGKNVDGGIIQKGNEAGYVAFDATAKYALKKILNSKVFDPYVFAGVGYTKIGKHTSLFGTELKRIPAIGRMTLNYGFGANFWLSNTWGVYLNFMAKYGVKQKNYEAEITNQLQFSFGGIYHIPKNNFNWRV